MNAKIVSWVRRSAFFAAQAFLLFALGCGPGPTPIVIISPAPPVSPTLTPIPSPTQTPPPTLEPPALTPFVPQATVKIFSQVPLSGDQAVFGQDILRGTELAIQQLGPLLNGYGYQVELVTYDDQNLVEIARANAQQIVADPEILCGVGHYDSAVTVAASDIYHLAGLAMVAPSTTAPILTDRKFREVNRVIGRADGQGIAAAQFAISQQYGSIFIVSQQDAESLRNAEYFRRDSGILGIKLLGMRVGNVTNANIGRIVSEIMNANPDLVYISSPADQTLPLLTELRAAGYTGTFLGTKELDNPELIALAGAALVEGGGMFYTIMNPPAEYYSETDEFIWHFNTQYGEEPLDFAARAYDATGMCLRAIERATEATGSIPPTRAQVAQAIRRLKYEGLTGTYDFNRQGDPDPAEYYVFQVASVDSARWSENPIVATYEIIPP